MIHISISRDKDDHICHFEVQGHSGFADSGQDIVCSAVSALVQTAVIGLTDVVGVNPIYDQKDGLARCTIPSGITQVKMKNTSIVLETMLLGLKSIELGYDEYITICERQVE